MGRTVLLFTGVGLGVPSISGKGRRSLKIGDLGGQVDLLVCIIEHRK